MQTFLPFQDFTLSARALDTPRLGKQRVENLQIMTALATGKGWLHHPATKMWSGHATWLMVYQVDVCREWIRRGHEDTCRDKTFVIWSDRVSGAPHPPPPWWIGVEEFHRSHRINLYRKDPVHYKSFSDEISYQPPILGGEYLWPINELQEFQIGKKSDGLGTWALFEQKETE